MGMSPPAVVLPYIFDVELSGKCNTVCTFCPRDEMKRGEQFMSEAHFEHFFENFSRYVRALEGREVMLPHGQVHAGFGRREQSAARVILCGMGESLMPPVVDQGPTYRICGACNDCERLQPAQIVRISPSSDLFASRAASLLPVVHG